MPQELGPKGERIPSLLPQEAELDAHLPSGSKKLGGQTLMSVVESYLRYYAAGEGHTARAKRYDLRYFVEFLAERPQQIAHVLVSDWTLERTQAFVDHRLELGEAPATVARRLATVKHFGRTLAERVHGFINPAREAKGPVQKPSKPHGLDQEEIEALRWAARPENSNAKNDFIALRNQFLVELLLATGLRADEVRLLQMGQVSDDFCWVRNVKTKGRKFRNVYLDSEVRILAQHYCEQRRIELEQRYSGSAFSNLATAPNVPVLVSFYGADPATPRSLGLSAKTIWRTIAETGQRAQKNHVDLLGSLHPHRLRHTFAHGLLDSSKDIRLVAQALGHSDVRTTMRYTERTEEEIAKAIEKKNSNR